MRVLAILAGAAFVALSGCGFLFLPYGEATVKAIATISIDGREFIGTSIWRVKSQTQNGFPDSGINYRTWVLGDAIEFEIAQGMHIFLSPQTGTFTCARREHPEEEYAATALSRFRGPCAAATVGRFTYVTLGSGGRPHFTNFRADGDELRNDGGGRDLSPDIEEIRTRGFAFNALQLVATREPLPSGMTERFPWILQLPRTDYCMGKHAGERSFCWSFGKTYAQYFTTSLPSGPVEN